MKKFLMVMAVILMSATVLISCTQNEIARNYGGTQEIRLDPGQRLVEATWKENDLWYLTEPMDSEYVPKTKHFKESSSWQVLEGEVIFIESR